jgi:hypothetical protein
MFVGCVLIAGGYVHCARGYGKLCERANASSTNMSWRAQIAMKTSPRVSRTLYLMSRLHRKLPRKNDLDNPPAGVTEIRHPGRGGQPSATVNRIYPSRPAFEKLPVRPEVSKMITMNLVARVITSGCFVKVNLVERRRRPASARSHRISMVRRHPGGGERNLQAWLQTTPI